ncbi:hypothetical protein AAHA92_00392 [Salvia divinorum]|uniref:Uncharacterized protein n=1 Tax=Salvia divinorum TaxID=28513 RepID=A0ABD1ILV3_SALDI
MPSLAPSRAFSALAYSASLRAAVVRLPPSFVCLSRDSTEVQATPTSVSRTSQPKIEGDRLAISLSLSRSSSRSLFRRSPSRSRSGRDHGLCPRALSRASSALAYSTSLRAAIVCLPPSFVCLCRDSTEVQATPTSVSRTSQPKIEGDIGVFE